MRVRRNGVYLFDPCGIDVVLSQHHSATKGQRVRVVQLPSAPKPNTMNHAHIEDADTHAFLGLVCCNSLHKVSR